MGFSCLIVHVCARDTVVDSSVDIHPDFWTYLGFSWGMGKDRSFYVYVQSASLRPFISLLCVHQVVSAIGEKVEG